MPTLKIGEKSVNVGDEFLKLSPDEQNSTVEEITKSLGVQAPPTKTDDVPRDIGLGRATVEAVKHVPGSTVEFGKAMARPFTDPVGTYTSIRDVGTGVLQKMGIKSGDDKMKYADAVGQFLLDRYGSWDNIKHTLATDPVGLAADAATILTGGGGLAARAPGVVGKLGEIASTVGRAVDPLTAAGKVVGTTAQVAGATAGRYLGHVGEIPITEAAEAGRTGGTKAEVFRESLRHPEEAGEKAVREARAVIPALRAEASRAYESGMIDISKDKTVLDFDKIDQAIAKSKQVGKFGAFDKDTPMVQATRDRMINKINELRNLNPQEYWTASGFDALKQSLGGIAKETDRNTPASNMAWSLYHSVRETIADQAPKYAEVMEGWQKGQQIIDNLEHELVGRPDAPIGPALRKLQSVMRNNVHSLYGEREALAKFLVDHGAPNLMTRVAGQALSSWFSRGLGVAVGGGDLVYGIGMSMLAHPAALFAALGTLPFMSPRLWGELSYYFGRASNLANRAAGETLFQVGRAGAHQVASGAATTGTMTEAAAEANKPKNVVARYDAQGNLLQ